MSSRCLSSLCVAALILASNGARTCASEMYAGTTNGILYAVNPVTAASTLVGPLDSGASPAFTFLTSLDFNASGQLYGLNSNGEIGLINTTNGQTSIINASPSGLGSFGFLSGLTINRLNGTAIVSDEDAENLYSVDLSTGNFTLLGHDGINFSDVRFDAAGNLYGVQYGTGNVYDVNLGTLGLSLVGSGGNSVRGMAVITDAPVLTFAETFDGSGSELRDFTPSPFSSTVVGQLQQGVGPFDGIAYYSGPPVITPEPASLVLLTGTAVGPLAYFGLRRRKRTLPI
jgi:hypothetical protein